MSGDTFSTLGAKVRTLDLDPPESAALELILRRARETDAPEVEGFGVAVGSLGFDSRPPTQGFKGTDEELQFKGSDEELQALIDWSAGRRGR